MGYAFFGQNPSLTIAMDNVACTGNERTLQVSGSAKPTRL
jgi:hypothetical protein